MSKIVNKGIKIDLHIHSVFSKGKDGDKVAKNTIENIPILVKGLTREGVELCAITDHDTFNYEMYAKLKEEEKKDNCIKKVLPGIEFSVEFLEDKVIHIVTIFDDKDVAKVKNIEKIMTEGIGVTKYKKTQGAYTRSDYFEILNEINVDFIMIAHQKKSVSSTQKAHPNDVMTLGRETFNELVFMDYFDAYEFRSKKNEIYNKNYISENELSENLRFITGSDCHRWEFYPRTEEKEKTEFVFTYIKSLPSFKGVAMAITDNNRVGLINKFFNPIENYVDEISIQVKGKDISIPMSKGINVIIGDNSIGKSLFLNAITGNYKVTDKKIVKGYTKYLGRHGIEIKTLIPQEEIFMYNRQGEIRDIFDDDGMKPNEYLNQFYPEKINVEKYRKVVEGEFEKLYGALENKFEYDKLIHKLPLFKISCNEIMEKSITFVGNVKKMDVKRLQELVNGFESSIHELKALSQKDTLDAKDKKHIVSMIELLETMYIKYNELLKNTKKQNDKINIFNTFMRDYKINYSKKITDEQAVYSDFIETKNDVVQAILEVLDKKRKVIKFEPNIANVDIQPETNAVDKYRFISKVEIEQIDNSYIQEVLNTILRKGKVIDTTKITESELQQIIKNYSSDDEVIPLDVLKAKISGRLDKDFKVSNTIVENGMDVFDKLSSGFDAQTYFTLLSGEIRDKGIYIIDQPEDHISQKAIKEKVLDEFRRMGQYRQVIMVTHNPQFIVNLDVDNVIYLTNEDGDFKVKSGALEYENEEYSILKIVADNIEGGLQTILGRMKRYEKNI